LRQRSGDRQTDPGGAAADPREFSLQTQVHLFSFMEALIESTTKSERPVVAAVGMKYITEGR